jgi:acyl dehydratase
MYEPKPVARKFADIAVGDTAQFATTITAAAVDEFARLSGDYNPLHIDAAYASTTPYKRRVAHGAFAGALFSRLLGMQLPGLYCVYLSQTSRFKNPIFLGTPVVVQGQVAAKSEASQTLTIALEMCHAITLEVLASGDALVKVLI